MKVKVVKVPNGAVARIAEVHGVTETMVYNALAMRTNSLKAQVIRKEAVELYGGVWTERVTF